MAALASRCDALANGYAWHLRIDDIDPPRVREGAAEDIERTLRAYGFAWDGDVLRQSLNGPQYQQALTTLIESGRVFPCQCTRRQCGTDGRCISRCRDTDLSEYPSDSLNGAARCGPDRDFSLRLCVLDATGGELADSATRFVDRIYGEQSTEPASSLGDIVLRRRDGPWSYALACAVDDSSGITDVVRGADLLQPTFAQRLIMLSLGRTCPQYAHLPVARDAQGRKLGKQTGAPPIGDAPALPSLIQAWHFLGQSFNGTSTPATLRHFWQYAADDWSIERVPAVTDNAGSGQIIAGGDDA